MTHSLPSSQAGALIAKDLHPGFLVKRLAWSALFFLLFHFLLNAHAFGAENPGSKWNEIIGKKVVNYQGSVLGYVRDSAIDLERGRYFGLLVSSGGMFSNRTIIVPSGAFASGPNNTLYVNMDKVRFENAPTMELSEDRGPPNISRATEIYRYYGQQPYFSSTLTDNKKSKLPQLGYLLKGSQVLRLPVENLQGKFLGRVKALTNMDSRTGRFNGVVIADKIVPPEALRYNFTHDRLRLNNHEQAFSDSTPFNFTAGGNFTTEGSPMRPGIPLPPLQQGNSGRDKAITEKITQWITANNRLSHYAKNIQVGTVHGQTTLRGRVQSQGEKNAIAGYSLQIAGQKNVINDLNVSPITARDKAVDSNL